MNSIKSKVLFSKASRDVIIATRNIFTKEYLGLIILKGIEKEAHAKAGKNVTKIKERMMKTYSQDGIKGLTKNEIFNFIHLVDGEKDMADLCRILEEYFANTTPDPKNKEKILSSAIGTCHLRSDLKYSRIMSQGAFFQTFDKNPLAILMHFQLLYDHGHHQELVDKFEKMSKKVKETVIVMAALCRIGTPEAYKKATEIAKDKKLMPEEGRTKVLFAWFSIQMGHYDIAIETLNKTKTPSKVSEKRKSFKVSSKISSNVYLFALVKSGKVDTCLSEMAKLNNTKFGFTPVYPSELIQEIKEAVKDDEKLIQTYKEVNKDLLYCYSTEKYGTLNRKHRVEEKGKVENSTVEELVFCPIDQSPIQGWHKINRLLTQI